MKTETKDIIFGCMIVGIVLIPILVFFGGGYLFGFDRNREICLNDFSEPLSLNQSWSEDGHFQIKIINVSFDDPDPKGEHLCTLEIQVTNTDLITTRIGKSLRFKLHAFGRGSLIEGATQLNNLDKASFLVPAGDSQIFQYQFIVSKEVETISLDFTIKVPKNSLYKKIYEFSTINFTQP